MLLPFQRGSAGYAVRLGRVARNVRVTDMNIAVLISDGSFETALPCGMVVGASHTPGTVHASSSSRGCEKLPAILTSMPSPRGAVPKLLVN